LILIAPLIVSFVHIVTTVRRLELDERGFRWRSLFFQRLDYFSDYSWKDVSSFRVNEFGYVVFDVNEGSANKKREVQVLPRDLQLVKKLFGSTGGLPDTFGLPPHDLAELLNTWKKK